MSDEEYQKLGKCRLMQYKSQLYSSWLSASMWFNELPPGAEIE